MASKEVIEEMLRLMKTHGLRTSDDKTIRHAARIPIDSRLLLKILDFEGGFVWNTEVKDGRLYLTVEHPDLPEVREYEQLPEITPAYTTTYGDDGSLLKIERTDPPKVAK